jgi:hypothetical protein
VILGVYGLCGVFLLCTRVFTEVEGKFLFVGVAMEVENMVENKYVINVTCCIVLM